MGAPGANATDPVVQENNFLSIGIGPPKAATVRVNFAGTGRTGREKGRAPKHTTILLLNSV